MFLWKAGKTWYDQTREKGFRFEGYNPDDNILPMVNMNADWRYIYVRESELERDSYSLKEKIERLKLERELRDLTKDELSAGQKFVEDILKEVGKKTLTTALNGAALYGMKTVAGGKGTFNRKELGEAIFNGGPKKGK